MKFTSRQYASALHQAIFETRPPDQEKILDNFVRLLKEHGDLNKLDEIEKEFYSYDREARGIREANVTSAKPLSLTDEEKLIKDLNAHVGGQVELKKNVDEGLVGGIVVRVGDELIDGSVKNSLEELRRKLIS